MSGAEITGAAIAEISADAADSHGYGTAPLVGHTFQIEKLITTADIVSFAKRAGDSSPYHHDFETAESSQFGTLIASGAQTTSLMLGAVASEMSKNWPNVGLGFSAKFRRAVYGGETITVVWKVIACEYKEKLSGSVVELEGALVNSDGEDAVAGLCQVLVPDAGFTYGKK